MNSSKLFIPLSIVVAGLIIAGAIFFSGDTKKQAQNTPDNQDAAETDPAKTASIRPVSENDHIIGSLDAEIFVIEYSDYECPFCGAFHPTMEQIMSEYGESKKVAWVYRHFPLDQIHKNARSSAEASECVAELNGNQAFWDYSKKLFENSPESLTKENLLITAKEIGVDETAFNECIESGRHFQTVEDMFVDGMAIAQSDPQFGTPYSIVMNRNGNQIGIPGAQPYEVVKEVIESLLSE